MKVPPRFELGSLDSKSRVLTITPWDRFLLNLVQNRNRIFGLTFDFDSKNLLSVNSVINNLENKRTSFSKDVL